MANELTIDGANDNYQISIQSSTVAQIQVAVAAAVLTTEL